MASADFCPPIPPPYDSGSQRQVDRPPRVMRATFTLIPAASTSAVSVQVPGFEDIGLLTHCGRLVCGSCSSGQCFACGFLQIPPRDGHPCRSANRSPCRVDRGLPPPSHPVTTTVNRNSASHGATRHAWRTKKNGGEVTFPSIGWLGPVQAANGAVCRITSRRLNQGAWS